MLIRKIRKEYLIREIREPYESHGTWCEGIKRIRKQYTTEQKVYGTVVLVHPFLK